MVDWIDFKRENGQGIRVNFAYTAADGTEIWGTIMTQVDEGQEVVAWAEAPATTYNDLESTHYYALFGHMCLYCCVSNWAKHQYYSSSNSYFGRRFPKIKAV